MRAALILGIIAAGIAAGLVNRFAALLLYLWFTFFRPQSFVWFDLASWRLSIVLGALLVIPALATGVFPDISHLLTLGMLAFLSTSLVAQLSAVDPATGWVGMDALSRLLLVSTLALALTNTRERLLLLLAVMSGSIGFHAAKAGLGSMLQGGLRYNEGIEGTFSDNNGYAVAVAMVLFVLIAVAQNCQRRWLRWGFYAAAACSVFTIISTFSRGGLLGLTAAALAFILLQRRRVVALAVIAAAGLLVLLFAPIPDDYFSRVETIGQYEEVQDASALGRIHFWHVAVLMARDRPFGVGINNYQVAYDAYDDSEGKFGQSRAVHSSHFQVLAELGFLGLFVYATLFLIAFVLVLRVRRRSRMPELPPDESRFLFTISNGVAASMVGFLVGGAFVALAYNELTWVTFAAVASLDRLSKAMCEAVAPTAIAPAALTPFRAPRALPPLVRAPDAAARPAQLERLR